MEYQKTMKTKNFLIGDGQPVYYIADIAANHGGDLGLAKELIMAAAESGASAAKFQNFTAETLVSEAGFNSLDIVAGHQSKWKDSVFESYKKATLSLDWTQELMATAHAAGIDYFTSAYSRELLSATAPYIDAIKIGSGDISYHELIRASRDLKKPLFLATGASDMQEVDLAVNAVDSEDELFCLMQCNTDYTAESGDDRSQIESRLRNINLRCLETFSKKYTRAILGLSDHTHGHLTVLGAVGLFDCAVVEKHFTFNNALEGQDHSFSMTPATWRKMVDEVELLRREVHEIDDWNQRYLLTSAACRYPKDLDLILGDGVKKVMDNELTTRIVQRRSICVSKDLKTGSTLNKDDFSYLRPFPDNSFQPFESDSIVGKKLKVDLQKGFPILKEYLTD
jgi:sialic acid synthase SpsE